MGYNSVADILGLSIFL